MSKEQLGDFHNISFEGIESHRKVAKEIIWKEKRVLTIIVLIISILASIYLFRFSPSLLIVGLVVFSLYIGIYYGRAKKRFFEKLITKNNLHRKKKIPFQDFKSNLVNVPGSKRIHDVLMGSYKDKKARLIYYSYTVRSGEHSITYPFTIMEVFYNDISFPHTLLHHSKRRFLYSGRHGKKRKDEVKIKLEAEFAKDYTLYIKDGYGIEAMQIFKEDFLRFLIEERCNFSIELSEDRMYIYTEGFINDKEKMRDFKTLTKEEFLESYSYLTEEEYDNTYKLTKKI